MFVDGRGDGEEKRGEESVTDGNGGRWGVGEEDGVLRS